MDDSAKRLLIVLIIGFLIGSVVALVGGLALYNQRYSGVVCMPESEFDRLYEATKVFTRTMVPVLNLTVLNFTI